jgi:hypothetical protein
MLPLIPILLIAKLSIALPAKETAMDEAELGQYLKHIMKNYPAQFNVDSAAGLLVAFHTFLVLLQSSNEEFQNHGGLNPETNLQESFPDTMIVASFDDEQLGWLTNSKDIIKKINDNDPFNDLSARLLDDYSENLKPCLTRLETLPDDFSIIDCLADCFNSIQVRRPAVLQEALKLGLDIISSADIKEAKSWTKEQNALTNTRNWLLQHINLPNNFSQQIATIDEPQSKNNLRQLRAMLFESSRFYREIISRLQNIGAGVHLGNDIFEAISKITDGLNAAQHEPWENLQCALYGAVSWHMHNQASYAARQIRYLLKAEDNH